MWIRAGEWGSADLKIKSYNIIKKFANMTKVGGGGGGWGKKLIHKIWIKKKTFFNLSLSEVKWVQTASSFY